VQQLIRNLVAITNRERAELQVSAGGRKRLEMLDEIIVYVELAL
jgi:hypothetical protein